MTTDPVRAVDHLIQAARTSPTHLPLTEVVEVHNAGHDVHVDASEERVIAIVTPRRDLRLEGLTPREQQVATTIAAGYTNRQVAIALSISVGTVKDHVHAILTKSGFETRSQMIAAWYGGLSPASPS